MTARARLLAPAGELASRSFEVGREITLGRAADNRIVLADSRISGHHGRIVYDEAEGCWVLEDLGSRNGTYLDGMRVREPEKLGRLEAINVGGAYDFIFQVPAGEVGAGEAVPAAGTMIERAEDVAPLPVLAPPAAGRTFIEHEAAVPPPGLGEAAAAAPPAPPARPPDAGRTFLDRDDVVLPPGLSGTAPAAEVESTGRTFLEREAAILPARLGEGGAAGAAASGHTLYEDAGDFVVPPVVDEETEKLAPAAPAEVEAARQAPAPSAVAPAPAAPTVAAYALAVERAGGGADLVDLPPGEHLVGRGKDCAVSIDNPTLSRKHARLIVLKGRVRLVDLGSTNHTFVDDREIPPRSEVEVSAGATLRFGAVPARLVKKDAESR